MRVLMLFAVVVTTLLATAAAAAGFVVGPSANEQSLVPLEFHDAGGTKQDTPYFEVDGAYPGMKPVTTAVHLYNPGTQAVAYDLNVGTTDATASPQIVDVLQASVIDKRTGRVAYRGSLADLRLSSARPLPAGQTLRLMMRINWPDGGDADNAYQGLHASFNLTVRARPIT